MISLTALCPEVQGFLDLWESNDLTLTKIHCDAPHRCIPEKLLTPWEVKLSQETTPLVK